MANQKHLASLKQGVEVWNQWREEHTNIQPDLSEATFDFANLSRVNLSESNLSGADFNQAILHRANLSRANPTVVDDWRERFGVCNGKVVRELDARVASMTRPGGRQKRETVCQQGERKAAGFRQR